MIWGCSYFIYIGKFVITGCCEKSVYEEAHDKLWLVVRSLKNADGKMV